MTPLQTKAPRVWASVKKRTRGTRCTRGQKITLLPISGGKITNKRGNWHTLKKNNFQGQKQYGSGRYNRGGKAIGQKKKGGEVAKKLEEGGLGGSRGRKKALPREGGVRYKKRESEKCSVRSKSALKEREIEGVQ